MAYQDGISTFSGKKGNESLESAKGRKTENILG